MPSPSRPNEWSHVDLNANRVFTLINHASGHVLDRPTYLADITDYRRRPEVTGTGWRTDNFSTQSSDDQVAATWLAGRRQHALDQLAEERPRILDRQRELAAQGLTVRRLVIAPLTIEPGGYAEFALESARVAVECGTQIRVLTDLDANLSVPEATFWGERVYRLRSTKDQMANGAVRLDRPDLAAAAHPLLWTLWNNATDLMSYYYAVRQGAA